MLHTIKVTECVLTFVVCLLLFRCAVCRCYERAVELVSVLYRELGCVLLSGVMFQISG
jgi:hypothetical protein